MNHTTNYQLSQWSRTDQVLMEDFNADNAKLDAALKTHDTALAGLTAAAPHWGNCQIYTTTYTGTGQYGEEHPSTLTFPKKPLLVMITDCGYMPRCFLPFNDYYSYSGTYVTINWSGNTVTWFATSTDGQMNYTGRTYYVVAFYAMD